MHGISSTPQNDADSEGPMQSVERKLAKGKRQARLLKMKWNIRFIALLQASRVVQRWTECESCPELFEKKSARGAAIYVQTEAPWPQLRHHGLAVA